MGSTRENRPSLDGEFFRGSDALACGALTLRELRDGPYRRIFHGIYASPGVIITHELRCRASALLCEPRAVVTGRSAATVHGVPLALPGDAVQLIVQDDRQPRRRTGMYVRSSKLILPAESTPWHDIRLATPLRAAFDLLTGLPIPEAVGGVDAMLRAGLVDREELAALVTSRHDNGVIRGRKAMELVDPRAESPKESELRVVLRLADLVFEPQLPIDLATNWRVRADLAREVERVIVEYDGEWHGAEEKVFADQRRRRALRAAGWTVLVFTSRDLRDRTALVDKVAQALLRANLLRNAS